MLNVKSRIPNVIRMYHQGERECVQKFWSSCQYSGEKKSTVNNVQIFSVISCYLAAEIYTNTSHKNATPADKTAWFSLTTSQAQNLSWYVFL